MTIGPPVWGFWPINKVVHASTQSNLHTARLALQSPLLPLSNLTCFDPCFLHLLQPHAGHKLVLSPKLLFLMIFYWKALLGDFHSTYLPYHSGLPAKGSGGFKIHPLILWHSSHPKAKPYSPTHWEWAGCCDSAQLLRLGHNRHGIFLHLAASFLGLYGPQGIHGEDFCGLG